MREIHIHLPENLSSLIVKQNTIHGYIYDSLTSTNQQIWQLRRQDIKPPFFVIAKQQTAGKGQRGNIWRSPMGGLYLSMILEINLSVEYINHLTLFSVYGTVIALRKNGIPVTIKWLNDLILKDKKLGGILCETIIEKQIIKELVIGIGINYSNPTPDDGINLVSFLKPNKLLIKSIDYFAEIIILSIIKTYEAYLNLGINYLIKNYTKLIYNLKEKILLENNIGTIKGINNQGNLQIKISSLGASSNISISPNNYSISYQKFDNYYKLIEKKSNET